MIAAHVHPGRVEWIGLRAERRGDMRAASRVRVEADGLGGDHGRPGKRAVTLIQAEHLPVISALAAREARPELLRRNIVVSRLNLLALRKSEIRIGTALLRIEGPCAPCSRMEEALGPGGFNAVRGHGGWCASVIEPGDIAVGDAVQPD